MATNTLIFTILACFTLSLILITATSANVVAYEKENTVSSTQDQTVLSITVPEINDQEEALVVAGIATTSLEEPADIVVENTPHTDSSLRTVPFYSQFADISDPSWKKVGCGIASLAMLIAYYHPDTVSVDTLLAEGIAANAYLDSAGWTYAGLIGISQKYGLTGTTRDFTGANADTAFAEFIEALQDGPVMASVHYTFEPTNPIPHLVIVNEIKDGMVIYNDPAEEHGGGTITEKRFRAAWKQRFIEFYPIS